MSIEGKKITFYSGDKLVEGTILKVLKNKYYSRRCHSKKAYLISYNGKKLILRKNRINELSDL